MSLSDLRESLLCILSICSYSAVPATASSVDHRSSLPDDNLATLRCNGTGQCVYSLDYQHFYVHKAQEIRTDHPGIKGRKVKGKVDKAWNKDRQLDPLCTASEDDPEVGVTKQDEADGPKPDNEVEVEASKGREEGVHQACPEEGEKREGTFERGE
ncbi:hypothetical protein JCM11641_005545 [Rhodosporidiobolus odoratus]